MRAVLFLLLLLNAAPLWAKTEDATSVALPVSAYGTYNGGILPVQVDSAGAVVMSGTIPSAGGWTDDGANVRLTTITDNVGIGTPLPQFKLQTVGNVGVGTTTTASTPYQLVVNNVATFNGVFQIPANVGIGTTPVNWNNGNAQNVGIGTNGTNSYLTFTPPTNGSYSTLNLRIKQDSSGNRALPSGAWPATVLWAGGTAPTLTTTANKSDWITCKWDGTNYYCVPTLNF